MTWFFYAIITTFAYAGFYFFSRYGASYIDSRLAPLVLNSTAVIILLSYVSYFFVTKQKLDFSVKGIIIVSLAGLCAAIGNLANFKSYELGGQGSIVIPLTAIGSLLIATLLSVLVLKEQFSISKLFGILSGVIGMYLLVK